jgi:hypothetical protein
MFESRWSCGAQWHKKTPSSSLKIMDFDHACQAFREPQRHRDAAQPA